MKATFNRTFLKELAVIPSKTRAKVEQLVFKDILTYSSYSDIPSVKKLKGYVHYYRIRVGITESA